MIFLLISLAFIGFASSACYDKSSTCAHYRGNERYYCRFDFARRTCPRLCNTCYDGGVCHDDFQCSLYIGQERYYCQHNWLKRNCRKMCKLCKPRRKECKSADHSYCHHYKGFENHYCLYSWVKQHCRNLCGLCKPATTTTAQPTTTTVQPKTTVDTGSGGGSNDDSFIYLN